VNASARNQHGNPRGEHFKQALADQLGLELVPGTTPIKMLVVEKAKYLEP
jgi:uncharacterized protein (TIGR03435 family)